MSGVRTRMKTLLPGRCEVLLDYGIRSGTNDDILPLSLIIVVTLEECHWQPAVRAFAVAFFTPRKDRDVLGALSCEARTTTATNKFSQLQ